MLNRRRFMTSLLSAGAAAAMVPTAAAAPVWDASAMRGTLDAAEFGVRAGALDDQSRVFSAMLEEAARRDAPIFLPPGVYTLSNIKLPKTVRLSGVPGATRIAYGGDGHLLLAEDTALLDLRGLILDGQNRWLSGETEGLLDIRRVGQLVIDDCDIIGSGKSALTLERCAGRIERSRISGAQDHAIYSVEAAGLQIAGNTVKDCGNGGILVHRWQAGEDRTSITGNRIERIGALDGGTGQFGNGINVFRAGGVSVTNNTVSDCAFSAIRANSASNLIVNANSCFRSGETALYAEFSFEGAVISSNIIDGAANGISVVNFNEGGRMATVTGNLVRNLSETGPYPADPPGFGVGISVEADTAVTGNVIENAPLHGMSLGWGEFLRNVVATGNVIRRTPVGVAVSVVKGAGRAVVSDNVIEDTPDGAIIGYRWTERVTGDLAESGAESIPHLTVERNMTG